jgi:hypothetical protein
VLYQGKPGEEQQGRSKLFSPFRALAEISLTHGSRLICLKIICVAKAPSSLAAREWRFTFAVAKS